ncbi:MAG: phage minor capsid protein [Micromonosporaceae bacterium]
MATPGQSRENLGESLAGKMRDIYADAELGILRTMALILRRNAGADVPDWLERSLAGIAELRRHTDKTLARLARDDTMLIEQSLIVAYQRGGREALAQLARWAAIEDSRSRQATVDRMRRALEDAPGAPAVARLVRELVVGLHSTHVQIARDIPDVYRDVVARIAAQPLLGLQDRLRAAQVAWEELQVRGVRGFTDRSGRRWELASYVEMATRTTVAHAHVQGELDRLGEAGIDLVIVSDAPQECKLCRPWEGKILAISRTANLDWHGEPHAARDRTTSVKPDGTLAQATAAGLLHPNCRHSVSAYLPGVTEPITNTADPEGDAARQRLRELERRVRRAKKEQASAITPEAEAAKGRKVRDLQAQIREHVATTTAKRLPRREQAGTAR